MEEDDDLLWESILLSRRGSYYIKQKGGTHQKKPSLQSMILEQLKFINDDATTTHKDNVKTTTNQLHMLLNRTNPPSDYNLFHDTNTPLNS